MISSLHNPYLVKVTTKGEDGLKIPKYLTMVFMDAPQSTIA